MITSVQVSGPPWPQPVFLHRDSSAFLNCTLTNDASEPFWGIDLSNDTIMRELQFVGSQTDQLNSRGVYKLPSIETLGLPQILRLLINDTARNNQTLITCTGSTETVETTLFVYGRFKYLI